MFVDTCFDVVIVLVNLEQVPTTTKKESFEKKEKKSIIEK
jgi:hypothetical protein